MKKSIKLLAAVLATITAMSCTSATAFADLSSDLAAISNQLSDNTNLSKLPIYNLSSNVPIKLNEYTDFSCDMVDCCLVSEEIYHISTMLSFQEKYDEWDKLMQDMRSYTNKKIPINSYEKLRKLKPFGILINVDGKCPGLLYRINDDILICAYYDIKYDNSGNIISLTNDKSMVNYCICNKLSASVLYKNCWYTSATDKDFTVYIGKNGLPVTKNSTIDGVRYIFNKYGKCEGKYTGWAKNSKGKVYYKNGVKLKNCWLKVNGKRTYYLQSNGIMAIGTITISRKSYTFDSNGKLITSKEYLISDIDSGFNENAFEIIENAFYGKWKAVSDTSNKISLTYNKSPFDFEGIHRPLYIGETDEIYYMSCISSGEGELYVIEKSTPNIMYVTTPVFKNGYENAPVAVLSEDMAVKYERTKVMSDKSLHTGKISVLGQNKLFNMYGEEFKNFFWKTLETGFDKDGKHFIDGDDMIVAGADRYLVESDEDHITLGVRFYEEKEYKALLENWDLKITEHYFALTFTRDNKGKWSVSYKPFNE